MSWLADLHLPDFLLRAWLAGIGVAAVAGPLGCFIVWRRMAYFGDTLAHAGLLGVALGIALDIEPVLGVTAAVLLVALLLTFLQQQRQLSADTFLGILAHASLAIGLVAIGFVEQVRIDLLAYLTGDVLAVSVRDIVIVWTGGAVVLLLLALSWKKLLFWTLHEELAQAEGGTALGLNLLLVLLMALTVAVTMKIVGILLITAMLIIPAATARMVASAPERMAVMAVLTGMLATTLGLLASYELDAPAGPAIVVAAFILFLLGQIAGLVRGRG